MKDKTYHKADCGTCAYHLTCTGVACDEPIVYYKHGAWRCDQYKPLAGTPGPRIDIET